MTKYTRGLAYARGTSIDPYLSTEDVKRLYELWDNALGVPNEFSGGQIDITCEMVLDASDEDLRRVLGNELAERVQSISRIYGG